VYQKALFGRKLTEVGLTGEFTRRVMNKLGESFALEDLRAGLHAEQFRLPDGMAPADQGASQGIWMLARSNYEVQFRPEQQLSERILFPAPPSQRTASRTPASFASGTTMAATSTTRHSPPTTAESSCRNWWKLPTSSIFASLL
jgi:hypothetical protein